MPGGKPGICYYLWNPMTNSIIGRRAGSARAWLAHREQYFRSLGNWQGSYTAQERLTTSSGVYTAKWQRSISNEWKVQVEVFTTLHCEGACEPPDPII